MPQNARQVEAVDVENILITKELRPPLPPP